MILTAHQPAYLPWLGLFHKIALADVYIFMDDVKYSKSDFSNRNFIKLGPDKKQWLTVPLKTGGSDNIIFKDIEIDNSQKWQRKHFEIIKNFYKDAPFFSNFISEIEALYKKSCRYLIDLDFEMLIYFLNKLAIKTEVKKASAFNIKEVGNEYLIRLCKENNSNLYIFGAIGKDYADRKRFEQEAIRVYFQEYKHPEYNQLYNSFVPYLCILDLLFNEGDRSQEIIMSGNIAKEDLLNNQKLYE